MTRFPDEIVRVGLPRGESEVIVLAEETVADLVIMDEAAARRELAIRGHDRVHRLTRPLP